MEEQRQRLIGLQGQNAFYEAERRRAAARLFDALNAVIPDPRNPVFTIHDQHSMLAQRITAIVLGYEDLNDH